MGRTWILSILLASRSLAWKHHLFTSSFSTPHVYALEFDDEVNSLVNIANITSQSGHPWLSFSYDKNSLYAGTDDGFASYLVINSTDLSYTRTVPVGDKCPRAKGSAGSAGSPFMIAEQRTPFNVFGAPTSSCGTTISVDPEGTLNEVVQAFNYGDRSQIQGLALDPENRFLYSADEAGNGIWTHSIDDEGKVGKAVFTQSPFPNSAPRKLVVHPNGRYLYCIASRSNSVLFYAINTGPGSDRVPLTYTGVSYNLLPQAANTAQYAGEEVLLSADANVLFASSRFRMELVRNRPSNRTPQPKDERDSDEEEAERRRMYPYHKRQTMQQQQRGYIRAILLTSLAEEDIPINGRAVQAGFPLQPLFHMTTRTGGGLANAVSPAPWSSNFFALADSEYGMIEVWKLDGLDKIVYTGNLAEGASTRPIGGWVGKSWTQQGSLYGPSAPQVQPQQPRPADPNQPKQPAPKQPQQPAPKQPQQPNFPWNQPKQPTSANPWPFSNQWGQTQNPRPADPWATSNPKTSSTPWWGAAGGQEEDDDDDRRRIMASISEVADGEDSLVWGPEHSASTSKSKSGLGRVFWPRQQPGRPPRPGVLPAPAAPATPPVTVSARIVASWQAPIGGGTAGRRFQSTNDLMDFSRLVPLTHKKVNVKPWTGSKKRSEAPPNGPPSAEQEAARRREYEAASVGKSCCANAVWYD